MSSVLLPHMSITIQFELKYFDIYGIRSDKDKLKKNRVFKYCFSSWYHYKTESGVELLSYVSSYVTL